MEYKILVLGGTEFVSAAVAKHLLSKKYTVDILTRGVRPLTYVGVRNHLITDRSCYKDMHRLLGKESYDAVMDINCYKPEQLLPVIENIRKDTLKRYIFCSTGGVYGFRSELMTEDTTRISDLKAGEYCYNKNYVRTFYIRHETTG